MTEPNSPSDLLAAVKLEGLGEISVFVDGAAVVMAAKHGVFKATRRLTPEQAHAAGAAAFHLAKALAAASGMAAVAAGRGEGLES